MDKLSEKQTAAAAAACNRNGNNHGNNSGNSHGNNIGNSNDNSCDDNGGRDERTSNLQYLFNRAGSHSNNSPSNSTWYVHPVTDLDDNNDDDANNDESEGSNNSADNNEDDATAQESTSIQELFNKLSGDNTVSSSKPPTGPRMGVGDTAGSETSIREMFNKLSHGNDSVHNDSSAKKGRKVSDSVVNYRGMSTSGNNTDDNSSIQYLFNKISGDGDSRPSSRAGTSTCRKASEGSNSSNIQHLLNRTSGNNDPSGGNSSTGPGNLYNMFTSKAELMLKRLEEQSKCLVFELTPWCLLDLV